MDMMRSRNPVLPPERYFPDGEPHFLGDELFVYPSCDRDPGVYCSDSLYVPHSKNLSDWTVEGPVFSCSQLDWDIAVNYPPGLMEAHSYQELPDYLKKMLPGWITCVLPFRLFQRMVRKRMEKCRMKSSKHRYPVRKLRYLFFFI